MDTLTQISRAQADTDNICISIIDGSGMHIRVEISLSDFADMITSGVKKPCRMTRCRFPKVNKFKP